MNNNNGIVLIHGAGLGNYVWSEINPHLKYPVLTINFPNRETGGTSNKNTSFEEYMTSAIQQIESWDKDQITIVAHSIGGCLGLKLNDYFQEKLSRFIGISAIIPKSGESFTDCFPFPQKLILPIILKLFGTKPPAKSIEKELCNDLPSSKSEEIIKRFSPESVKLYTTKINYNSIPEQRLFIKLLNDNALNQDIQNKMIRNLNCKNIVELDSGHLPMLSKPKELAGIINEFLE